MRTIFLCLLFLCFLAASLLLGQSPQPGETRNRSKQSESPAKNRTPEPAAAPAPAARPNQTGEIPEGFWRRYFREAFSAQNLSNWFLAVGAAVAAIIALRTLGAIQEQARISRVSLTATRQVVHAARLSALAAEKSNMLTQDSNAITQKATDLTRQALVLTHRPRLIVRSFHSSAIGVGSTAEGAFQIANVGGTRAKITRIFATAIVTKHLPMKPPYDETFGETPSTLVGPGEFVRGKFRKDTGALLQQEVIEIGIPAGAEQPGMRPHRLCVLGFVNYIDELDPPVPRQTAFCRVLRQRLLIQTVWQSRL
jgi:hypothetical protein